MAAVNHQREVNRSLGQIAVELEYLSPAQVEEVHAEQQRRDLMFGELAVEKGYLTRLQVEEILSVQKGTYMYLGEVLVQLGHLHEEDLEPLLAEFKELAEETAPLEVQWEKLAVSHPGEVTVIVDQMGKLLLRVCGMRTTVGSVSRGGELDGELPIASLQLTGDLHWELSMCFGQGSPMALSFTERFMGLATDDPEMVADASCEYLNIVAGNSAAALVDLGCSVDLRPPRLLQAAPRGIDLLVIPYHSADGDVLMGIQLLE
jgi:CheY-specific phosphatase CheX